MLLSVMLNKVFVSEQFFRLLFTSNLFYLFGIFLIVSYYVVLKGNVEKGVSNLIKKYC